MKTDGNGSAQESVKRSEARERSNKKFDKSKSVEQQTYTGKASKVLH